MPEHLNLKFGTLKGWNLDTDQSEALLKKYASLGMTMGAAQQVDTPEQKEIICDLIDAIDGDITNDWTGEHMTKDAAKKYVREYE